MLMCARPVTLHFTGECDLYIIYKNERIFLLLQFHKKTIIFSLCEQKSLGKFSAKDESMMKILEMYLEGQNFQLRILQKFLVLQESFRISGQKTMSLYAGSIL